MKSCRDGNGYYLTAEWETDGGEKQGGADLKSMQFGLHAPLLTLIFPPNFKLFFCILYTAEYELGQRPDGESRMHSHTHKALYIYVFHTFMKY